MQSCAYLHNFKEREGEPILSREYGGIIKQSPVFFADDQEKLEKYIYSQIGMGNGLTIIDDIENSKIRPSKKLVDYVSSIMNGNKEYVLLDEQRLVYEEALSLIEDDNKNKKVFIVRGGPGTGKSVVAINLFSEFLRRKQNAFFVAPNSSFRDTLVKKLADDNQPTRLRSLFKGSSGFCDSGKNEFDVLVVDESHRLKNQSAFMYKGDNQVRDIIKAAKVSIFFIDDNQMVRPSDIGCVKEIKKIAAEFEADVAERTLEAQFRCSGVDGYINWLDDTLQIRETANYDGWEGGDFDFRIYDNPNILRQDIEELSDSGFSARILAGYAWKWSSVKEGNADGDIEDVEIPEFDFKMPWNSRKVGTTWAIDQSGIKQVGCIHTSQGLEFDYVGVIVGEDLDFDFETMSYSSDIDKYQDNEGKKGLKDNPERLNTLIRNIYKILFTRGMKGCYVYFCNKNVEKYFKEKLKIRR